MTLDEFRNLPHDERCRRLADTLSELKRYDSVTIERERDWHLTEKTGEDLEPWRVAIHVEGRLVEAVDSFLDYAIVEAANKADTIDDAAYKDREAKRKAAREKLTDDEAAALGLR
jgi:hypothetical protein